MKRMFIGAMVAAGSLAATAVRAQETDAGTAATATGQSAQPVRPAYGAYVVGDATTDADGVPVAKPNPMSRFLEDTEEGPPIEMPLVDEPPANSSGSDTQPQ
jgi:hypothetical protein